MKQEQGTEKTELVLILGDMHIPQRIHSIPDDIKKVLTEKAKKFHYVLCTGNIGNKENFEWIKSLCSNPNNVYVVKGESVINSADEKSLNETHTIKIGEFKISIINGYQIVPWGDLEALSSMQKLLECDILISGFTHQASVFNYESKYYLNPGSLTGAYSPLACVPSPSFMLLVVSGEFGHIYQYELNPSTKNFDISKLEITKNKSE